MQHKPTQKQGLGLLYIPAYRNLKSGLYDAVVA